MGLNFNSEDGKFSCCQMRGNKCKIVSYIGEPVDELVIPSEIDGLKVVTIDSRFAKDMDVLQRIEITKLIISEGITRVCSNAFESMLRLRTLVLPSTLKNFGTMACYECLSLKDINLEDTKISEIKDYTFERSGLEQVCLPNTVKTMGYRSFSWCKKLESIKLSKNLVEFKAFSVEGSPIKEIQLEPANPSLALIDGVLYTADLKTLIYVPPYYNKTRFIVPDGVETIESNAFYNQEVITDIVFPNTLKTVKDAFRFVKIGRFNFPASTVNFCGCIISSSAEQLTIIINGYPKSVYGLSVWSQNSNPIIRSNSSEVKKWAEERRFTFKKLSQLKAVLKDAS